LEVKHILAFVTVILFFTILFLSKAPGKSYLTFTLICLPFIDLNLTSEQYGAFSVFDVISYTILLTVIKYFFNFEKRQNVHYFFISALTLVLLIGSITSEFIVNSIFDLLQLFSIFIYARILISECLQDSGFFDSVIKCLKISAIFSLLFLVIQLFVGTTFTFYPDLNPNVSIVSDTIRYPSYFQDPQKFGQYLSMLCFVFLIKSQFKKSVGILNIFFFSIMILAVLLTGARAAFLGCCVGLSIIIFSKKKSNLAPFAFISVLLYLLVTSFSEYFSFFNRSDDFDSSVEIRNQIWNEGFQIFFEHPFLGIGIGNHHNYILEHSLDGYYLINNEIIFYGTESGYLQLLIEYGIFGFIIALLIILTPVILATLSFRKYKDSNTIVLLASTVSWLVAFVTVNSLSDKRIFVILTTLLSLLIVFKNKHRATHG